MKDDRTVAEFLIDHKGKNPISFHVPGHKGRELLYTKCGYSNFVNNMVGNDVTSVPGADNLFNPESTIRRIEKNYEQLYGVRHTELLVNGATSGVIAAILTCVEHGGTLILARNSHHSAYSAMRLGDICPVYLRPQINEEYGVATCIKPEDVREAIELNPEAGAVFITSPSKIGMLSNVEAIANICHEHDIPLIIDQAHGAHLKFFDYSARRKNAAENLGADIVIDSTHKNLFSFTGSAILNVCSESIDCDDLKEKLRILQTTSPSYMLLGSLDVNEKIMTRWGDEIAEKWKDDLRYFYHKCESIPGLSVVQDECLDMTKISISMAALGLSGENLDRELRYNNIWPEMIHGKYVLLITGAGNTRDDYVELANVLRRIADKYGIGQKRIKQEIEPIDFELCVNRIPKKREKLPLYLADGRVAYSPIVTYPPGSPLICPGEILNMEVISYISKALARNEKIVGVDEEGEIYVGIEEW